VPREEQSDYAPFWLASLLTVGFASATAAGGIIVRAKRRARLR
jgi:hypothetical protein